MDKILICMKCQRTFVLSSQKQYTYQRKNFPFPKHCPQCLAKRSKSRQEEVERQRSRLYEKVKQEMQ